MKERRQSGIEKEESIHEETVKERRQGEEGREVKRESGGRKYVNERR